MLKILTRTVERLQAIQKQITRKRGTYEGWEGAYAYANFDYSDDSDLQRVYDEQYRIDQERMTDEQNKRLDKQTQMFIDQQQGIS